MTGGKRARWPGDRNTAIPGRDRGAPYMPNLNVDLDVMLAVLAQA